MKLTRTQAENVLDDLRELFAEAKHSAALNVLSPDVQLALFIAGISDVLGTAGIPDLQPCNGEAHRVISEGGDVDHCHCAPRWGWTGERVKIT